MKIINVLMGLVTSVVLTLATSTKVGYNLTILTELSEVGTELDYPLLLPPDHGLYLCRNPEWKNTCIWGIPVSVLRRTIDNKFICQTLPWKDQEYISFGPDKCLVCDLYTGDNCDGFQITLAYPGDLIPGPASTFDTGGIGFKTYRCKALRNNDSPDCRIEGRTTRPAWL